jgi:hypothetical protein
MFEMWAGHFGSSQERESGCREFGFSEDMFTVAAQVGYGLEMLPVLAETMGPMGCGDQLGEGYSVVSRIIVEAAQKTIESLVDDIQRLRQENSKLLSGMEALRTQQKQFFSHHVTEDSRKASGDGQGDLPETSP